MDLLLKHFWIIFIIFTILHGIILKIRSIKYIKDNPDLEYGYNKLFKGVILYGNIPWAIMGIGNILHITTKVSDYFNPKSLNPSVLLFHASIIVIWILTIRWVYFNNGANFLSKHPGLFGRFGIGSSPKELTEVQIKIYLGLCLLGGLGGMIMMWIVEFPLDNSPF